MQLLQLVHGRHDPSIRSRDHARRARAARRRRLRRATPTPRRLDDAYVFLRTVEHRLQLWDEQQTHTLPTDDAARVRLARVLGYRDRPRATALEAVRRRPPRAPGRGALDPRAALLRAAPRHARRRGRARRRRPPRSGSPRSASSTPSTPAPRSRAHRAGSRRTLARDAAAPPVILDWLRRRPTPTSGCSSSAGSPRARRAPRRSRATFRDSPGAAERTCRILGSSRVLGDALLPPARVRRARSATTTSSCRRSARATSSSTRRSRRSSGAPTTTQRRRRAAPLQAARAPAHRARATSSGFAPIEVDRARARRARRRVRRGRAARARARRCPFAVIGMGRLGGRELSYASDIDVLFVYDGDGAADFDAAERIATQLHAPRSARRRAEGQTFRDRRRLRPEGKQGPLARSLDGLPRVLRALRAHRGSSRRCCEARPVAGDPDARRSGSCDARRAVRVPRPVPATTTAREVRRMKARIERERIPPGEDPQFHLKLGRGSLSDVEFTVQLLQLQHGAAHPEVRDAGDDRGARPAARRRAPRPRRRRRCSTTRTGSASGPATPATS